MSDKMMRIAGRTSGGTAVPMAADANGNIGTTRTWKKEWVVITESPMEIRDTSVHDLSAKDVSGIPLFSLRILNRLGVPVTLGFKTDVNTTNGYSLLNPDATSRSITVAPANSYIMITPEDLPMLNYIRYLRITIKATSAPESGIFEACMVTIK